jgi:hypothetical protein
LAEKPKDEAPKRLNRAVGVSEALQGVLDAALKKRGFATRDLVMHWGAMAPKPYDALSVPDQLKWPRGAGHEGATLYLRCAAGHALALSHEAPLIAAAVNRYFGYFLVKEVRLSAEPMTAPPKKLAGATPRRASAATIEAVEGVSDPALKEALLRLGTSMGAKRRD